MVVFLDIIFLVNVLIDGALLWATARTRSLRFRWWRLAAAAVLGGVYVVFLFFPPLSFLYTLGVKVTLSLLMLLTAFGFGGLQHFARNTAAFYAVNFAAAGAILGLYYIRDSSDDVLSGLVDARVIEPLPAIVLLGLALGFWLFRKVLQTAKRKQEVEQFIAQVEVRIGDVSASCAGLIDTGNQLYDPLTKTPVMVMEAAQWGDHIPEAWLHQIRRAEVDQIIAAIGTDDAFMWQDRLRLVPYRGVNRNTQFMLAIKPDRVIITSGDKRIEAMKVLVGLDGGSLSADQAYQAIIHPALLQP